MYSLLLLFVLAIAGASATAAPVRPDVPCDRPILLFGSDTVLGQGVRATGLEDRMRTFFSRVCGDDIAFETHAREDRRLIASTDEIIEALQRHPRAIAFVHFPFGDIEAGSPVSAVLNSYRRILATCRQTGAICVIGGQQPVNAFDDETSMRQRELEESAEAAFAFNYLPIYRYMRSEVSGRRLMLPLDSGDGRFVDDYGHILLFTLYRNRLLQLTGPSGR